jgi:hypothetical protein
MNKVNLFLVGNQKSGSTALAKYLDQHDDVCVSSPKATNYFSNLFVKSYRLNEYSKYKASFKIIESRYFCDASDCYHADKKAIEDIYRYNSDAKIVVVVRNPFSMLNSLHQHLVWAGYEDINNVNEAWHQYVIREGGKNIPRDCPSLSFLNYRSICSVGSQMEYILKIFPRENVMVCFTEDLKFSKERVLGEIFKFLDLKELKSIVNINTNEAVEERSRLLTKINRRIPSGVKVALKNFSAALGYELDGKFRVLNGKKSLPSLPVVYEQEIIDSLNSEISLLEVLLGKDLRDWKQ